MMRKRSCFSFFAGLLALCLLASCQKEVSGTNGQPIPGENLILIYGCGHNNGLSSAIEGNVEQIMKGKLPSVNSSRDMVLYLQHSDSQGPQLNHLYRDIDGKAVCKKIQLNEMQGWDKNSVCISSDTLQNILTYISKYYKAQKNYLIFSSHASGWVPAGTFLPDSYTPVPTSIGQDLGSDWQSVYEMELSNFAQKLPFYFDAIIMDACLMGGIEVAYELKDKCGLLVASPTEILSRGMYYESMLEHIYAEDIASIGRDYIQYYLNRNGSQSATCSVIDCRKLEPLAAICKELFDKYRENLMQLAPSEIQHYYRSGQHWFYDLGHIVEKMGASAAELESFNNALLACTVYRGHTPYFLEIPIVHFSGLSTYLPSDGTPQMDLYYKGLAWNKATNYIQ